MNSDELRSAFLRFYEERAHKIIPSSSLIPHGDPTLLLTSAGMVQIKPYFLGQAVPPSQRLVSCQKCFRATDIDSVGDATHNTFFEMLGNFSVGDYFKKEAIGWAWEFITQHMKLPAERLWATIFLDDEEAFNHWREQGLPEDRILRFSEEDNFWGPVGDSGPCGPDTEIFYDYGMEVGCGKTTCGPNCKCGRFIEIGTLVFMQYNQDKDGRRSPLPKPSIDTGMGLERNTAVVQGKRSIYETDLFMPLLECVARLSGKTYGKDEAVDRSIRVMAEHSRGITFLIADGVVPGNEGRGYVLRRLLRRAALFGRKLGLDKPFLTEITSLTMSILAHVYPELIHRRDFALKVIHIEETRFNDTLGIGLDIIDGLLEYREAHRGAMPELIPFIRDHRPASENAAAVLEQYGFEGGGSETGRQVGIELAAERISCLTHDFLEQLEESSEIDEDILREIESWGQQVSGEEVFVLYDTYGFPPELTKEIAASRGFTVNTYAFDQEMDRQRERSRKVAISETLGLSSTIDVVKGSAFQATRFVGYEKLSKSTTILGILVKNNSVDSVTEGQEAGLILEATPFYGEMGGQVGDTGQITGGSGSFSVTDTTRMPPDSTVHKGRVVAGMLRIGDKVEADVDRERRLDIARNHTATHLLQAALRQVLGEHIQQRGSLVAPERLRFDFSHLLPMTGDEINKTNHLVNEMVRRNLPVYDEEVPYKNAVEQGAIALFGEKYGDIVRLLQVGRPPISAELCGGTHVNATGDIGFFHITSESSIGASLRRIEAVTGRGAEEYFEKRIRELEDIAAYLETDPDRVLDKAQNVAQDLKDERKRTLALERELSLKIAESLLAGVETVDGVKMVIGKVPSARVEVLREMGDWLRDQLKSVVVVLGTVNQDRPAFLVVVTPDLVARGYNAGDIVRQVAKVTGGSGGGKPNLAQAGGKDKQKLDEALRLARDLIKKA